MDINNRFLGKPNIKIIEWIKSHRPQKISNALHFIAVDDDVEVALNCVGTRLANLKFQISVDGTDDSWTDYKFGDVITLQAGSKLFFRAKSSNIAAQRGEADYLQFATPLGAAKKIDIAGNCTSMLTPDFENQQTLCKYAFLKMFSGCNSIRNCSKDLLPLLACTTRCYDSMFANCNSLVQVPDLPAISTEDHCYNRMFYQCNNLVDAQEELKVEKLNGQYCYCEMYRGCTKLRKVPIIKAKSLYAYCFRYMFWGCTNLKIRKGGSTSTGYVFMSIPSDAAAAMNWAQGAFGSTGGSYKNDPQIGVEYQCYGFEDI